LLSHIVTRIIVVVLLLIVCLVFSLLLG